MNASFDDDALAHMFAAQANLRARLLALRLSQPDVFRARRDATASNVPDEDEVDAELIWLAAGPAGEMERPAESYSATGQRRCA